MKESYVHSFAMMGTVVTIQIVGHMSDETEKSQTRKTVARAVDWFQRIEDCCSRFEKSSEVTRLSANVGVPFPASPILYELVQFSLAMAEETEGAFDPTIGRLMERRGFNENYRTGDRVDNALDASAVSYRDICLNPDDRTITLARPLMLDLGAVAKGLAVDMAARELSELENFAVDAGGDMYLAGENVEGKEWAVGIRHPRERDEIIETLRVSDAAVCTSGDYERVITSGPDADSQHHIVDPRSGTSATDVASVTVVAPTAMVADAFATAAFVLGPRAGIELLERNGLEGFVITPSLERFAARVRVQ